jgi:hypothetical protein
VSTRALADTWDEQDCVGVRDTVMLEDFRSDKVFNDNLENRFNKDLIYVSVETVGLTHVPLLSAADPCPPAILTSLRRSYVSLSAVRCATPCTLSSAHHEATCVALRAETQLGAWRCQSSPAACWSRVSRACRRRLSLIHHHTHDCWCSWHVRSTQ